MKRSQVIAGIIDRERTRVEDSAVAAARASLRGFGFQVAGSILNVGDARPLPEIVRDLTANLERSLRQGLIAGTLTGRLRSQLTASRARRPAVPLALDKLARSGDGDGAGGSRRRISVNQRAAEFLRNRLGLNDQAAASIEDRFSYEARTFAGELGKQALVAAEKIAVQLAEDPLPARDATRFVLDRLSKAGFSATQPYVVETIYRTNIQAAYSAGRLEANRDPAIDEILWGYRYSSVMDDRTTELCASLDGMTQPKDAPCWSQLTPPNHYNCRSTLIEVFTFEAPDRVSDVPAVDIPRGFAVNWGEVLRAAA